MGEGDYQVQSVIRIKGLSLRTIIGFNEWERRKKQDVVIDLEMRFDAGPAMASDDVADTLDYKSLKRRVIDFVEDSRFHLLESLAGGILAEVMKDAAVLFARVEVDKPHALRFCDSVSVVVEAAR